MNVPSHQGKNQFRLDAVGAVLSFSCAVHCMVMPVAATLLPFFGLSFLKDTRFEIASVCTCLGMASLSLIWGFSMHRRWTALLVMGCAAAMLISARTLWAGECSCCSDEINWRQLALAVGGGVLLGISHLVNRRLCRCPAGCCA